MKTINRKTIFDVSLIWNNSGSKWDCFLIKKKDNYDVY